MKSDEKIALTGILKYAGQIKDTIEHFSLTETSFYDNFIAKNAIAMCLQTIEE